MQESEQVFFITVASMGVALILAVFKYSYKSKCEEVDVCCIHIKRNVQAEIKYDIEHPADDDDGTEKNKV